MADAPSDRPYSPDPRTRRSIRRSRTALAAERAVRAFWPLASTLCLAIGLALFGLFEAVAPGWHPIAAGLAGGACLAAAAWGLWSFRWPSEADARARLDEAAPERPLAVLADRQASGRADAFARAVWLEHQRRAEAIAQRLAARPADLKLSPRDVWALRLFAPVVLVAGLIAAGPEWQARLASLIAPPVPAAAEPVVARVPVAEAWAMPPAYTGEGTIYLDREAEGFTLPEGSRITVRVTDLDTTPQASLPGVETEGEGFRDLGAGLHELTGTLRAGGPIAVEAEGELLASWQIAVIADDAPEIAFDGEVSATFAGAAEVPFRASDDNGVASAGAEVLPTDGLPEEGRSLIDGPLEFALPLPIAGDPTEVADVAVEDVSEHPLAGGEVAMTLRAEDGAGQTGASETRIVRLPGRHFSHPLAKALVEQRRALALDFDDAARVLDVVQAVTRRPEAIFEGNHGAYLAVRTAIRRLAFAIPDGSVAEAAPEVAELLWQAALELDGGDLNDAMERLRAAQRALEDALENGTEEDIRRAMEEMRAAMDQYLREFARRAMEEMQAQDRQQGQQGQQMTRQDLQEMLDEMQRRAESGLRDEARDMLSQLSRMLENLQMGRMQPGEGSPGQQAMEQLQELIQRQRELSDRTFGEARRNQREGQQGQQGQQGQRGQQGQQGQQGQGQQGQQGQGEQFGQGQQGGQGQGPGGLSQEQQALRRMLDDLMGQLPGDGEGTREALDGAGQAMDEAQRDLDRRSPGEAVDDQLDALDRLAEGAEQLMQQLEQQGQGQQSAQGAGRGRGEGRDQQQADPFDRPAGRYGAIDGDGTDVPDRALMDRARELLEELRRRAGEAQRPEFELDYLERLIERY
ncbi:MAG: TIGR02302 family protein [Paracoccaceae bacterium]